jgi:hypothetical protein
MMTFTSPSSVASTQVRSLKFDPHLFARDSRRASHLPIEIMITLMIVLEPETIGTAKLWVTQVWPLLGADLRVGRYG